MDYERAKRNSVNVINVAYKTSRCFHLHINEGHIFKKKVFKYQHKRNVHKCAAYISFNNDAIFSPLLSEIFYIYLTHLSIDPDDYLLFTQKTFIISQFSVIREKVMQSHYRLRAYCGTLYIILTIHQC